LDISVSDDCAAFIFRVEDLNYIKGINIRLPIPNNSLLFLWKREIIDVMWRNIINSSEYYLL
jgi:hypothetical protein